MSQPIHKKAEIAAAYCRSYALSGSDADDVAMSLQSAINAGVLIGHRPDGAGKTSPLRYTTEEACFACVVLTLKDFGFSHEALNGLRPGFFDYRLSVALGLVREGHPVFMALRYGYIARNRLERVKPYIWAAIHPEGHDPDWESYLPDTRPPPAVEETRSLHRWPLTGELRAFLAQLESD